MPSSTARSRPARPSLLDAWLDLVTGAACVACERPGRLLCGDCAAGLPRTAYPTVPQPCPPGLVETWVGGAYDGALREMVLAHKERRAFALARPLGASLAVAVRGVVERPTLTPCRVLLVPVPSRAEVVRERGHDPLLRLTRRAARVLRAGGHDVAVAPVLRQHRRPRDQAGLDAAARRTNLEGSMAARTPLLARLARSPRPVLTVLCDDVVTTGATAREGQRALEAVGLPVAGVAAVCGTVLRSATHDGAPGRPTTEQMVDPSPTTY